MRRVGEARILGGRTAMAEALTERAEEHDARPSPRPLRANIRRARGFRRSRIGRVQRARQSAVLGAFAVFTKSTRRISGRPRLSISLAALSARLVCKIILMQADMHIGRHRHIHHLRVG